MTILRHEWKQNRTFFAVWTLAIGFLIAICVFMFPEMKGEMESVGDMFASMGSFTKAFGMDRLSFGTLLGFYSVECGSILGLGGAFFSSLLGVSALLKDEKEGTAEFLLSHPVSRGRVVTEKLLAVFLQVLLMNVIIFTLSLISVTAIGEDILWREFLLLHLAYFLLQIELAGICFGISAFLRRGGFGIGLGIAAMMYFLNIIANISVNAEFLKYITPFGYCEGADIVLNLELNGVMVAVGIAYTLVGILLAYVKYCKKDIH